MDSIDLVGPRYADGSKDVSVVIPVYNAMPYLTELLDSLSAQSMSVDDFEVILVDDGSTDGSADELESYCSERSNFRVIHQANSGWAGAPRNAGLDLSVGTFVFFADSDDVLDPSALADLFDFAQTHGSDVVIPRLEGFGGRIVPEMKRDRAIVDVDLATAFRTLGPIKMYRRSLLESKEIRFPEGKIRLEDGIFNAHVYLSAQRVSWLTEKPSYYVRARDDGNNISSRAFDPEGYTGSVAKICDIVNASDVDPRLADRIVLGLYQRKCLKIYRAHRFASYTVERSDEWLRAHRSFVDRFIRADMEAELRPPYRLRSQLVRAGAKESLLELSKYEAKPTIEARLTGSSWTKRGLRMQLGLSIKGHIAPVQISGELRHRDQKGLCSFSLKADTSQVPVYGEMLQYSGLYPSGNMRTLESGVYDLHITYLLGKARYSARVTSGSGMNASRGPTMNLYSTDASNVSLKKQAWPGRKKAVLSVRRRAMRRVPAPVRRMMRDTLLLGLNRGRSTNSLARLIHPLTLGPRSKRLESM